MCCFSRMDSYTKSAVFRFLTHSRVITPFSLTIGGSPYNRRDINLRLAPSSYYGSLGAATPLVEDTLFLHANLFRLSRRRTFELASTR